MSPTQTAKTDEARTLPRCRRVVSAIAGLGFCVALAVALTAIAVRYCWPTLAGLLD